ncbi:MAG: mannose-1-phosphate guanylyltransferase/mannose-6-phosphate isomerase [Bdellovibrio sp. CG10_big_fil_rev_8_21_14_0_10_47_8]|nr:MAG: mannose-1-phosphate guanylyltransferase/mannose-6-phosphate isomerase [Bdellovibrio sp. CG10_big_fil_rev_8_21_14_0_10_47_8]
MIPVILSGGSGTRLWPVSRTKYPKQFYGLFEETLQSLTIKRLARYGEPWILTSQTLKDFTEKKAREAGLKLARVVYEPVGKNTAPAIALLCKALELEGKQAEVVGIFPADHLVERPDIFWSALDLAEASARENKVVTLGLKPTEPATGYGYIQTEKQPYNYKKQMSSYSVLKFHEKPNSALAQEFIRDGSYFWNAGIFVFRVSLMIELFERYQPQIWDALSILKADLSNIKEVYASMPSISIDYAIMEKLTKDDLLCVPCDPLWNDVGSWDAVADVYESSGRSRGEPIEVHSKNNFVLPKEDKKYAFVGVDDLIVVDTDDALLIAKRGQTQDVKLVVDRLNKENSKLAHEHTFEERPWGRFEVLRDKEHFKSKVIRVDAHQQISYQSHAKREEHWVIVKGEGEVILDEQVIPVKAGSYVKIPLGAKHRIRNTSPHPIEFIEVQLGAYFGEDDIVRYQDDYRRN